MSNVETRDGARTAQRSRPRWVRVRVETDEGAYVGRLRLDGHASVREAVLDTRAYLGIWSVTEEPSGRRDDFVALHKGAIRYVVPLGDEDARRAGA